MLRLRHVAVITLGFSLACHPPASAPHGASQYVIPRQQIEQVQARSIYDVIVRLHAEFLNNRGRITLRNNEQSRAVVFLNEQEYGALESMRDIPPDRIEEVRFFPGPDAVTRFGAQYGGGVIQLRSRVE